MTANEAQRAVYQRHGRQSRTKRQGEQLMRTTYVQDGETQITEEVWFAIDREQAEESREAFEPPWHNVWTSVGHHIAG